MELDYKDGEFIFRCAYSERAIPKGARFFWNGKVWVTRSARCAIRLREYATEAARHAYVDGIIPRFQGRDETYAKKRGGGIIYTAKTHGILKG